MLPSRLTSTHHHRRISIMTKRYWIVGGEYEDTQFTQLKPETGSLAGPYISYDDALAQWRHLAAASRFDAHARYTIATETANRA